MVGAVVEVEGGGALVEQRSIHPEGNSAAACTNATSDEWYLVAGRPVAPGDVRAADLRETIRRLRGDLPVIIITAFSTTDRAIEATKKGAFDYLVKPFELQEVETRIKALFPQARVARMDRDTTAPKGALLKILKDLQQAALDGGQGVPQDEQVGVVGDVARGGAEVEDRATRRALEGYRDRALHFGVMSAAFRLVW